MDNNLFIGVDLGTSGLKLVITDKNGNILHSYTKGYELNCTQELCCEQNPIDWYNSFIELIEKVSYDIDIHNVQAIGFTGQMHGLVLLDENDDIIRPAILWNDQRCYYENEYINNSIGIDKLLIETGNISVTGFTAAKLLWVKNNELFNFKKISKIMLPKDYLIYKITGKFVSDYSDASGTLLFNVKNKNWSKFMLDFIGIKTEQMPRLISSGSIVGTVDNYIMNKLGFINTQIIIGGGDQPVAAVGAGISYDNVALVSLGTSGVVFTNVDSYPDNLNGELHIFSNATDGFCLMGVTLSAASSLKWWMNILNCDFSVMDEKIKSTIKNKIIFLPYLCGERTPHNDSFAKGVIFGLDINSDVNDITKSILEGVVFSIRDSYELIHNIKNIDYVVLNGGGSKSEVWCQIMADVLQLPIKVINSDECTALGAALLAIKGVGYHIDIFDYIYSTKKIYTPDENMREYYNNKYYNYKKLYLSNRHIFEQL